MVRHAYLAPFMDLGEARPRPSGLRCSTRSSPAPTTPQRRSRARWRTSGAARITAQARAHVCDRDSMPTIGTNGAACGLIWSDPAGGGQIGRTSQHGIAALALGGNAAPDRIARAFDWATDPARETSDPAPPVVPVGTPLDEEHGVVVANTFYSQFRQRGAGPARPRRDRSRQYQAAIRADDRSRIDHTLGSDHAMGRASATAFRPLRRISFSRHVLGVAPAKPGFARARIMPDLFDLDFAEGVVPAGSGEIAVELRRGAAGVRRRDPRRIDSTLGSGGAARLYSAIAPRSGWCDPCGFCQTESIMPR